MTTPTPPPPPVPPPPYGGPLPGQGPPGKVPQRIAGIPVTPVTALIFSVLALCGVCGGLGAFGAIFGEPPEQTAVQADDTTTTASTEPPPTTEPAPTTPPPPAWPEVPLDMATVEARLRDQDLEPASVQVNGGIVTARYKPTAVWDEDDRVHRAGKAGYDTTRALEGHAAVESVRVELLATGEDRFGNDTEVLAVWSQIDRATFKQINWDGLSARVGANGLSWICLADRQGALPAVSRELEDPDCLG